MELQKTVTALVKRLVSEPDQVEVIESQKERAIVFSVRVAKKDMGKIIGRNGKNIEALRTIVGAFGVKQNKRCVFYLVEEDEKGPAPRF